MVHMDYMFMGDEKEGHTLVMESRVIIENSPVGRSKSNGIVERAQSV